MRVFLEVLFWSLLGGLASFYLIYFGLMVHQSRKASNVKRSKIFPKISLIIPVHNESEVILSKLENTRELNYPKDKLEILVVDDGSTDNTCQLVQSFMDRNSNQIKIRLISLPQWSGKASALNYAWQYCTREIVVMTDADATLEENAIGKMVQNFADPMVGAVTGRLCVAANDDEPAATSERNYRSIFDIIRMGESRIDSTPIFNGLIMAFRRELLDELELDTLADDTELSLRVREKGWKALYDSEVIAYEFTSENRVSRAKQKLRRGRGIIQSFIRHKNILFNRRYGKYGLVIFPCEFFMHIISPLVTLSIIALVPMIVVGSLPSSISIMVSLSLIVVLLLAVSGLILAIRKQVLPDKKGTLNPIAVMKTFLAHQVYLILTLFSSFVRAISKRGKTEDVRSSWKTKNQ